MKESFFLKFFQKDVYYKKFSIYVQKNRWSWVFHEREKYIGDLVAGGADEFFTGYTPDYWYEKFGFEVSPNGRFSEHEQITDRETLEAIVAEVHKHGFELFINLNAWYYTDVTFPFIQRMVEEFIELGIDGIICGNLGILEYLQSIDYPGKINISTIMAVYNTQAIQFLLENYPINKVILSREITLKEIEHIVKTFPDTKFEVFGEGDFCRYNNGLCYAEHKYSTRDICTVVADDLVFKKKFRADSGKIILDNELSDAEKIVLFSDTYEDIFAQIGRILTQLELFSPENVSELQQELTNIYIRSQNRIDLFFDGLLGPYHKKNTRILTYVKGLKYLLSTEVGEYQETLQKLHDELQFSIQTGMTYFFEQVKQKGGEARLHAHERQIIYAKGDDLNLYTYLFFSQFPNIDTVKFPTRGRNYYEKIQTIAQTLRDGKVTNLSRGVSIERAHYDLTYLFGEKLWFRQMLAHNDFS